MVLLACTSQNANIFFSCIKSIYLEYIISPSCCHVWPLAKKLKILKIWIFQNMTFIYLNFPQNITFSNIMVKVCNMNTALARWEYQNLKYDPFKHCSHQGSIFLEISTYRTEEISYFHPYNTAYLAKSISCILVSSLVSKRVCWLLLCVKSSSNCVLSRDIRLWMGH